MSQPNKQLLALTVAFAALCGLAVWALWDGESVVPFAAADAASARTIAAGGTELEDPATGPAAAASLRTENPGDSERVAVAPVQTDLERALGFLQSILPERFAHLTLEDAEALTSVDLRDSTVRDEDLAHLAAMPSLTSVCLRMTSISDAGLKHLVNVPKLTTLDLSRTNVTRAGVLELPAERLEVLHLTDTAVKGEDLRWLPAMPKLSVLKLNGLDVGDDALAGLARFPALEHLELARTPVTDEGLRDILMQNRGLRRVDVWRSKVTADAITSLSKLHPAVRLNRG